MEIQQAGFEPKSEVEQDGLSSRVLAFPRVANPFIDCISSAGFLVLHQPSPAAATVTITRESMTSQNPDERRAAANAPASEFLHHPCRSAVPVTDRYAL